MAEETEAIHGAREALESIRQLLHGLNNHAVVVCGYIDEGISQENIDLLRFHSAELRRLLVEVSKQFGRLYSNYVGTLKNGKEPD